MSAIESAGSFTMPPLSGTVDGLWEVILDLADQLPPASWALVGMVIPSRTRSVPMGATMSAYPST